MNKPPIGRPDLFEMRVATLEEEPFVIYGQKNPDGSCDNSTIECLVCQNNVSISENNTGPTLVKRCCTGLTIDLLKELSKDLNFKVILFEVEDKKWGGWSAETEEWNGLVRVLQDKKADLVMTSLKITPNRSSVIDFSMPFQETGIAVVVALREGIISATAFLEPYDFPTWCVILIFSVHTCGTALFIYEWLSPRGLDCGNVSSQEHKFSLFRAFWLIWSMLFGAAVNANNPRGMAGRFLASIWALFALVFLASYTANLAVVMIAKENFYNLKGINDWRLREPNSHVPPFRFATIPSGATEENIKMNFKQMYQYMRNFNKSTINEGIEALNNGEIDAFIYDAKTLEYKVSQDRYCKLRIVGNWYAMTGYGVGFPKNSKWLPLVNTQILKYQKFGLIQRWEKYWLTGACKKSGELGNTNQTLGVKNFISAFILLIAGIIICFFLLLLEHCFYRYLQSRVKSWNKYNCCRMVSLSMDRALSLEQSVYKTINIVKHCKCDNPVCEIVLWKTKHELDIARRKIRKLEAYKAKLDEKDAKLSSSAIVSQIRADASVKNIISASNEVIKTLQKNRQASKLDFCESTCTVKKMTVQKATQSSHKSSQNPGVLSEHFHELSQQQLKIPSICTTATASPAHININEILSQRNAARKKPYSNKNEILYKHPQLRHADLTIEDSQKKLLRKESPI